MQKTTTSKTKKAPPKPRAAKSNGSNQTADLEERLYRAELLLGLSQKIASLNSLDDILNILVEITTREMLAERGFETGLDLDIIETAAAMARAMRGMT